MTEEEARAYIASLATTHPGIREVWLHGSRANKAARSDSDWDFLVFADSATLAALRSSDQLRLAGVDLLIVTDGDRYEQPWPDRDGLKAGSLVNDLWEWQRLTSTTATYTATKKTGPGPWDVKMLSNQLALRWYPSEAHESPAKWIAEPYAASRRG